MKSNRLTAFEILYDITVNGAYSNIALDNGLKKYEGQDKGFISNLVYGVIERQLTLDYIIEPYIKGKIKPKVKILLRMGVYQLYFMDKVPASAAINECVEVSANVGCEYYKKYINAVLHNVDKNRINIEEIDDLSIKYSCPTHLIRMWTKMYGEDSTKQILENINKKACVFAIPNKKFVDANELLYELNCCGIEGEVIDDIVMISSNFDLSNCKAFSDGLFYIEDKSSYTCAKSLGAKENEVVLDMCASPGGKSFTIAQDMNNTGKVYSFDLYEHRCKLICDGAKRLEISNIEANVNDALKYNEKLPLADKILCDVPCSGFGIIRRKPEIRYKELDSIKDLPNTQYDILSMSARYLKNGGRIIYSTCTLNKKENEKVVNKFLEDNKSFVKVEEKTTFPTEFGGDGFYYAVMEKLND